MSELDALDLEANVKTQVQGIIRKAEQKASDEAIHQAKIDFRAGVAGSRRPDMYDPSTTRIASFLDSFEPFRLIMNLDGAEAINTFLTYLDQKSLNTLIAKGIATNTDWKSFCTEVTAALSSPRESVKARYELKKAKQRPDETVAQFGERIIELAKVGYSNDEREASLSILKDALTGGLSSDEIAVTLINDPDLEFHEALEKAIKLDGAYRARSSLRDEDNLHVSVLKNEIYSSQTPPDPMLTNFAPRPGHVQGPSPASINLSSHPSPDMDSRLTQPGVTGIRQGSNLHPQQFVDQSTTQHHQDTRYPYQLTGNPDTDRLQSVQCYKCHQFGHYATNCPLYRSAQTHARPSSNNSRHRNLRCHFCGIFGHVIKDCRKRLRHEGLMNPNDTNGMHQMGRGHGYVIPRFSELGIGNLNPSLPSNGVHHGSGHNRGQPNSQVHHAAQMNQASNYQHMPGQQHWNPHSQGLQYSSGNPGHQVPVSHSTVTRQSAPQVNHSAVPKN